MSPVEVQRLPKVPHGIGLACDQAAAAMEAARGRFTAPAGVTVESLKLAGFRAERIDSVIRDLDVVNAQLRQANLIFDADAWEQLRKVNDQIKAQAKYEPELSSIFQSVADFFGRSR